MKREYKSIKRREMEVFNKMFRNPNKTKFLKEGVEQYIPEEIKNLANQGDEEITSYDPRYKVLQTTFDTIADQDWAQEFHNWCNANGFNVSYDSMSDKFIVQHLGTGLNESQKFDKVKFKDDPNFILPVKQGRKSAYEEFVKNHPELKLNEKKKSLKEMESIPGTKPFNKYDYTDNEKAVMQVLESQYKKYTLLKLQANGSYININLKYDLSEDIQDDLELKRFIIAKELAQFRQDFLTDLSSYISVVNVSLGAYEFVKGTDTLKFGVTILLSDTSIHNWVSGIRDKTTKKI